MVTEPTPAVLLADPDWLPFRLDLPARRCLLLKLGADQRRSASFLDERILAERPEGVWIPCAALTDSAPAPPPPPPAFVFHVGHCGSTLLSRLLETWPGVQALREPLLLRTLAAAEPEAGGAQSWVDRTGFDALLNATVSALSRPQSPNTRVLIKATSSCNNLIEAILARQRQARAIVLTLPLAEYLATVLKSPAARQDAFGFAPARLGWLIRELSGLRLNLFELRQAEVCAMGWLAEQARFQALLAGPCGERLLLVDFRRLLADIRSGLEKIAGHFGWPGEPAQPASCAPVLGRYAKAPEHNYDAGDRAHDLALAQERYGDEIQIGLSWAETVISGHPALRPLAAWLR